jgi:hypothetical protein
MDVNPLHNLEYDLMKNDRIVTKCKTSDIYSQNLYAALCNNQFLYGDKTWTCSWRMSGGIVADIRDRGESYLDFYCSGIGGKEGDVGEGFVTDEIKLDLMMMGWIVKPYEAKQKRLEALQQLSDLDEELGL